MINDDRRAGEGREGDAHMNEISYATIHLLRNWVMEAEVRLLVMTCVAFSVLTVLPWSAVSC